MRVAGNVRVPPPADLISGSYVRPSSVLYAASVTLDAEDLIRRAVVERGREHLDAAVNALLDEHYPSIGADERGGLKNAVEAGRHSSHTAAAPTSQAATNGRTPP